MIHSLGTRQKMEKNKTFAIRARGGAGTPRAGYHCATIAQHNYIVYIVFLIWTKCKIRFIYIREAFIYVLAEFVR